ncbi:MAG: hypothetical protein J5842_06290, partial [Lachnospiraceae bacterium]|nr:hypothetical protein [Lachnospiraceae bacterium]
RDEADDMKSELADRFGKVPQEVENLLRIALLKQAVKPLYVNEISGRKDKLKFVMDPRAKIRNENIVFVLEYFRGDLKVVTGKKPGFELTLYPKGISPYDEQNLLARAEELAEQMRVRLL